MNFRNLKAEEIDLRIGQVVKDKGVTLLCYQNARCGMDILDETVGAERWSREHYEVKGNMFCRVGIMCGASKGEPIWVYKSDCGVESNTEKEKGEASDSFKRALVNWGIGRELYSAPFIWITLSKDAFETDSKTQKVKLTKEAQKLINGFKVSNVEYREKVMTAITIVDCDGVVVYKWKEK